MVNNEHPTPSTPVFDVNAALLADIYTLTPLSQPPDNEACLSNLSDTGSFYPNQEDYFEHHPSALPEYQPIIALSSTDPHVEGGCLGIGRLIMLTIIFTDYFAGRVGPLTQLR
jgi:hypothetical protein